MWNILCHLLSKFLHSDMDQADRYNLIKKQKKIEHFDICRLFRVCYWSITRDYMIERLPKKYVLFSIWIILQWKDEFNVFFPVIHSNIALFQWIPLSQRYKRIGNSTISHDVLKLWFLESDISFFDSSVIDL